MRASRSARAGLGVAALIHSATFVPNLNEVALLVLLGLGALVHFGAMALLALVMWRLWKQQIEGYDATTSVSGRAGCISGLSALYIFGIMFATGVALEGPGLEDAMLELQLTLRFFSAGWMLFLGLEWRLLRASAVIHASEALRD